MDDKDDLTPLDEDDQLSKDTNYSPGSDRETTELQSDPQPDTLDSDIDDDAVHLPPGTGGPDEDDVDLPRDRGAH